MMVKLTKDVNGWGQVRRMVKTFATLNTEENKDEEVGPLFVCCDLLLRPIDWPTSPASVVAFLKCGVWMRCDEVQSEGVFS